MGAFIGRQEEKDLINGILDRENGAILIYGKRKVGKTTLIKEVLQSRQEKCVYYECLKNTMKENLDAFTRELVRSRILPVFLSFQSFIDLFTYLNTIPEKLTVVIDEYPYLKQLTQPEIVDSSFQNIIDNHLGNIHLILSGSHIGMMKDMVAENNALYGRFQTVIHLKELDYHIAASFYQEKTSYEKIAFHSVFGGSPYVLEKLDPDKSLRENVIRTILNPNSPVFLYVSFLLMSDYSNTINAERIFSVLGNGRKRYRDIENQMNANQTGNVLKQLKTLVRLELIKRAAPINRLGDAKKTTYEINDNLMRFYFTYIYKNRSALEMIGPESFYDEYIAPTIRDFISRRFEEICRNYFSIRAKKGLLPGLRNIGSYYYDDSRTKTNGEFDVALDYGGKFSIFEVKYLKNPMEPNEIHHELGQIRDIKGLEVFQIGFISANGFTEQEEGILYYTGDDIYSAAGKGF